MLVTFRFYAELNDFLPRALRHVAFDRAVPPTASVKDAIEALGVPHPEIDLLLVNGDAASFDRPLADGDRVAAWPVFRSLDVAAVSLVTPGRPAVRRFVLDTHLGRLAAYLRLAGFDTLYRSDYADQELAAISSAEARVLLTRDVALLKRTAVHFGYFVRTTAAEAQLEEVASRFDLGRARDAVPFTRCPRCNTRLESAAATEVAEVVPPRARAGHDDFRTCPTCRRVFWKGTHYERLVRVLAGALR